MLPPCYRRFLFLSKKAFSSEPATIHVADETDPPVEVDLLIVAAIRGQHGVEGMPGGSWGEAQVYRTPYRTRVLCSLNPLSSPMKNGLAS